jgi:hypothetical protein
VLIKFWWEIFSERESSEDLSAGKKVILNDLKKKRMGGYGLDSAGKDRDLWQILESTVMGMRLPQDVGNFLSN